MSITLVFGLDTSSTYFFTPGTILRSPTPSTAVGIILELCSQAASALAGCPFEGAFYTEDSIQMRQSSILPKGQQVRFQEIAILTVSILVLLILLGGQAAVAQRCHLSPSLPTAIPAGGSYGFSADCGTGVTWEVDGDGTITSDGTYYAPTSVRAPNQDRGCQVSPLNSPYNVPVDNLPVDQLHTDLWLGRAAEDHPEYLLQYHSLRFSPQAITFYSNVVDDDTPQEIMHFYYSSASYGYQDTPFPVPSQRNWVMQSGTHLDATSGYDRHLFTINKDTCETTEIYNFYVDFRTSTFTPGSPTRVSWTTNSVWDIPQGYLIYISGATGAWSQANGSWRLTLTGQNSGTLPFDSSQWGPAPSGITMSSTSANCNNCNSAGGQKFRPTSYAQLGGVDAAGLPIGALSVKTEEWYAATRAGRSDLGHAIRTTLSNGYLSARNVWPATLYALGVSGFTNPLTAATNANPVTFTTSFDMSQGHPCDNYTFNPPCDFHVSISGISSGPWTAANGDSIATATDNYHFTIPLDTRSFGAFPGAGSRFDFFPYGATVRLKSSFDIDALCSSRDLDTWCPYAKVYLNTIKKYGLVVADGTVPSDNWDSGIMASEFHPDVLLDAAMNIHQWSGLQPIEQYLEVVDRSSQEGYSDLGRYQDSNVNRTTVTVHGSYGDASTDILLQGTTIGTDKERLLLASGVSYQLNVWVNGNVNTALSYSVDSGIPGASVSSTGLLTMPSCTTKQRGFVTVTSVADPDALPLYIEIACLPVSSDGSYRLALGNYTGDYTDSSHNTWWGSWNPRQFYNAYEVPGLWWGLQAGTWEGQGLCSGDTWSGTDSQLFSRSTSFKGDTMVEMVVPNGTYNLTLYGEPGYAGTGPDHTCPSGPGMNIFDWVVQGHTVGSWLDGYVLAGQNYTGYTLPATATVTDNVLDTSGRMRVISTYGMSWSSLLVSPATQPQLTITTSSLAHAFPRIPYLAHLNASNGFPPYTWSLASDSQPLPPGLTITNTGLIFGRPSDLQGGTYPFTVQVTDTQNNTTTKDLTITVCHAGHLC